MLAPANAPSAIVDVLLTISHLARLSAAHAHTIIEHARVAPLLGALLRHASGNVRSKSCNLVGNLCRHSDGFYAEMRSHKLVLYLVHSTQQDDSSTRKFAAFAFGARTVALFSLHPSCLAPRVPAGTTGNLVRTSASLCDDIIASGALHSLAALIAEWSTARSKAELQPCKIALFSLGSMCSYTSCREALLSAGFLQVVGAIKAGARDELLRK